MKFNIYLTCSEVIVVATSRNFLLLFHNFHVITGVDTIIKAAIGLSESKNIMTLSSPRLKVWPNAYSNEGAKIKAITNGVTSNSNFFKTYPNIPKNNKKYKSAGLCLNTNDPANAKIIVKGIK